MIAFIFQALLSASPIVIAAAGGLLSQKAGVLNIALEGIILSGAFAAALAGLLSGSVILAVAAGTLTGFLVARIQIIFRMQFRANIFIIGLGINLLAAGIIPAVSNAVIGTSGVFRLPAGFITPPAFAAMSLTLSSVACTAVYLFLRNSRYGIELQAAGVQQELLRRRGGSTEKYQKLALSLSGICAGLAGALLSLRIGAFAPAMSAGRGWIALGTIFLGFQHPFGIVIGAILYGLSDSVAGSLQGRTIIPSGILMTLPYAATTLAYILSSAIRYRKIRE
ncbi:ABC transporter permease subunit [Spirochaeta dissipatitropha]